MSQRRRRAQVGMAAPAIGLLIAGPNANLDSGKVQSSNITRNSLAGVRLASARGINVGGTNALEPSVISQNGGWGILASGWSSGSALSGNIVTQ